MGNFLPKAVMAKLPTAHRPKGSSSSSSTPASAELGPKAPKLLEAPNAKRSTGNPLYARHASFNSADDGVDAKCWKVAKALCDCDVFLLCVGSGFVVDSGLPLCKEISQVQQYRSRGLTYASLCDPCWLENDLSLFYGFWGTCFNDSRWTRPHAGYGILASWRDKFFQGTPMASALRLRQKPDDARATGEREPDWEPYKLRSTAGAFFVFTSNTDAHIFDYFDGSEVRECQGNTELWQCSNVCSKRVWRAPPDYIFRVDLRNMLASDPPGTNMDSRSMEVKSPAAPADVRDERRYGKRRRDGMRGDTWLQGWPPFEEEKVEVEGRCRRVGLDAVPMDEIFRRPNRPICPYCKSPARPNVLMFSDLGWIDNDAQERRWNAWQNAVKEECQLSRNSTPVNMMIMEIGAGTSTLPVVRSTSQSVAARLEQLGANITVVRINPTKASPDGPKGARLKNFISIPLPGLEALERINDSLQALMMRRTASGGIRVPGNRLH